MASTTAAAAVATSDPAPFEITDEQRPLTEIPISPPNGEKEAEVTDSHPVEQLTVFHSSDNFNVKHPLMNKWTLWFTKPPSGKVRRRFENRHRRGLPC